MQFANTTDFKRKNRAGKWIFLSHIHRKQILQSTKACRHAGPRILTGPADITANYLSCFDRVIKQRSRSVSRRNPFGTDHVVYFCLIPVLMSRNVMSARLPAKGQIPFSFIGASIKWTFMALWRVNGIIGNNVNSAGMWLFKGYILWPNGPAGSELQLVSPNLFTFHMV